MENFIPVQIKQFPQPPAEPSDNSDSHSSGNGYKATPVILVSSFNMCCCLNFVSKEHSASRTFLSHSSHFCTEVNNCLHVRGYFTVIVNDTAALGLDPC